MGYCTILLIVAKINKLDSNSINFFLAFPQADLPIPVYMEIPPGVTPIDEVDSNSQQYFMRLNKSLYGLKSSGHNWFEKLRSGLTDRHFAQSQIYKCVFCRDGCIILTYVDYCITNMVYCTNLLIVAKIHKLDPNSINFFLIITNPIIHHY